MKNTKYIKYSNLVRLKSIEVQVKLYNTSELRVKDILELLTRQPTMKHFVYLYIIIFNSNLRNINKGKS